MEEDPHRRDAENCSRLVTNSLADIESSLQRDAEAAYVHTEVWPHWRWRGSGSLPAQEPAQVVSLDAATSRPPAQGHFLPCSTRPCFCASGSSLLLGTAQLPPGRRREEEQAAPRAPSFPRGCWVLRSVAAVLLGKSDVIAGLAGKRWETRSL